MPAEALELPAHDGKVVQPRASPALPAAKPPLQLLAPGWAVSALQPRPESHLLYLLPAGELDHLRARWHWA